MNHVQNLLICEALSWMGYEEGGMDLQSCLQQGIDRFRQRHRQHHSEMLLLMVELVVVVLEVAALPLPHLHLLQQLLHFHLLLQQLQQIHHHQPKVL